MACEGLVNDPVKAGPVLDDLAMAGGRVMVGLVNDQATACLAMDDLANAPAMACSGMVFAGPVLNGLLRYPRLYVAQKHLFLYPI